MVGEKTIKLATNKEEIVITVKRKYSIITGNTGSGKTYIPDVILRATDSKDKTARIWSTVPVYLLNSINDVVAYCQPSETPGICIIDENDGKNLCSTEKFAKVTKKASHYFVIISREALEMLPYSVKEIYELFTYDSKAVSVTSLKQRYSFDTHIDFIPEIIITEDSGTGYQFFKYVFNKSTVISAGGKSNVPKVLSNLLNKGKNKILVVVDGAAFGSNVDSLCDALTSSNVSGKAKVCIYMPESFEWVILSSDIFKKFSISDELIHTEDYAETSKYKSWEDYYTHRLIELSHLFHHTYNKSKLSNFYLSQSSKIMNVVRRDL